MDASDVVLIDDTEQNATDDEPGDVELDWWLPGLDPIERIYLEAEIGMGE